MTKNNNYLENCELLIERFPSFIFFNTEYLKKFSNKNKSSKNVNLSLKFNDLENVEAFFIYGIGKAEHYSFFSEWLKRDKKRKIIFLEDNENDMKTFLSNDFSKKVIQDEQVFIQFLYKNVSLDVQIKEVFSFFAYSNIKVLHHSAYKNNKRFEDIKKLVLRKHTLSEAVIADILRKDNLFSNFLENLKNVFTSWFVNDLKNKFPKIPVIICGAGPSLNDNIDFLKEMNNKAIIIACGSAITSLSYHNIRPHITVAIDPTDNEYDQLKNMTANEILFVFSSRVNPRIFNCFNAILALMHSSDGQEMEQKLLDDLGIISEKIGQDLNEDAMSVSSSALSLSYFLGCDPVILCGVDLAYTKDKNYAAGILEDMFNDNIDKDDISFGKNYNNQVVKTNIKWLMEQSCFSNFTEKNKNRKFYTVSKDGLKINNIKYKSSESFLKELDNMQIDINGLVFSEIIQTRKINKSNQIVVLLHNSLNNCKNFIDNIIKEIHLIEESIEDKGEIKKSGKWILNEIELEEEKAFKYLFSHLDVVVERIISPSYGGKKNIEFYKNHYLMMEYVVQKNIDIINDFTK